MWTHPLNAQLSTRLVSTDLGSKTVSEQSIQHLKIELPASAQWSQQLSMIRQTLLWPDTYWIYFEISYKATERNLLQPIRFPHEDWLAPQTWSKEKRKGWLAAVTSNLENTGETLAFRCVTTESKLKNFLILSALSTFWAADRLVGYELLAIIAKIHTYTHTEKTMGINICAT